MKTILKFPIYMGQTTLRLPQHHTVVHAGPQHDMTHAIWVEADFTSSIADEWRFTVYGTGMMIPLDHDHVATWIDETFVWHLYRVQTA